MTDVTYYERCETQDGRTLEYLVEGDPNGFPLVHHHGTPGAAVPYPEYSEAAAERGLALIQYSRAGYGESTPRPDRTVADVAEDIAAILDHRGHTDFVTLGWSGGGPHSLACAAMLPERCLAAATGAGVAGTGDIVADLTGGVNSALQGALDAAGNAWSSIDVDAFGSGQSDAGLFANGLGDLGGHIDPVVVDPAAALDPGHDLLP